MVYFVLDEYSNNIKIGKTTAHISERVSQLFCGVSFPTQYLCLATIPQENDDRVYHNKFRLLRSHKEWYKPGIQLLSFIATLPITEDSGYKMRNDSCISIIPSPSPSKISKKNKNNDVKRQYERERKRKYRALNRKSITK